MTMSNGPHMGRSGYARRSIARVLKEAVSAPVLILEGARAVGKTTLMKTEFETSGYSYVSLADPSTRELARFDTEHWLRGLRSPAIIDEAQLEPVIPLLLKSIVDEPGASSRFILTGSASIDSSGLGGVDPLSRRSQRFTMNPLTLWERAGQSGSLVDLLFDGEVNSSFKGQVGDDELLDRLSIGGFPGFVYPARARTRRQITEQIRSDISSVLSNEVLPERGIDHTIARTALDSLLRVPGGIYNASRLGQQLDLDRRTVDRYLGVFQRVFLLHLLPNLATTATRQGHSRSKVHPVDTSFAVESLSRAGVNLREHRESFGALLESHVVNELRSAAAWAETRVDAFYWREASDTNPEVDLVFLDDRGRAVGIEVKSAHSVGPSDTRGLRAFAARRGLHRGFVFYAGDHVLSLGPDIWAMPLSALESADAFDRAEPSVPTRERAFPVPTNPPASRSTDAAMFLSYVHADNEQARGRIVRFAQDLVQTYEYLYGRPIDLFIDRDSIGWGEDWASRLRRESENTTFLLAILTPRYLISDASREEVLSFTTSADESRDGRSLLPINWVDISHTDVVGPDDPVRKRLIAAQYEDGTALRRLDPESTGYTDALEKIAGRLRGRIVARDASLAAPLASKVVGELDEIELPDLIEALAALEDRQEELEAATGRFKESFEAISVVFGDVPAVPPTPSGARATFRLLGQKLTVPVHDLDEATAAVSSVWNDYESSLPRLVEVLNKTDSDENRDELAESMEDLVRTLELPGAEAFVEQLELVGNVSKDLRPLSRSVRAALLLLEAVQESARTWALALRTDS